LPLGPALATATLFFALVAHAGANVINDYYDAISGCDSANTERQFPFTGGSRFIQNGVLSLRATGVFGYALLIAVIPAGLWLTAVSGPELILIGLAGLVVGWSYSAPPLKLQSRGLGEFAITAGWLLVVVGSDFVQRHGFLRPGRRRPRLRAAGRQRALHQPVPRREGRRRCRQEHRGGAPRRRQARWGYVA
jgi:1,4-dihydroxy-2-naphthoate octaprenyltransferase